MKDEIHIAIPATGEYRKWAEVTAASAVAGSSLPVKIHYIDWSVISRDRLERLGSWHGSAIAFSRLFLAEIFPDLDWVITCDADVLFRGDVAELWEMRDESVSFIAHKDCPLPPNRYTRSHYEWYEKNGFVIKDWDSYFADGLGLVNLKRWREKGCQKEFEHIASKYRDWPSPDMMIINFVLQDDKKLLPVEWDCFSGDENADVDWSKSGAVHFVEDTPWRRYKITHLASDLVEEWWTVAELSGIDSSRNGYHGCRNYLDWLWRRIVFLGLKYNQWVLKMHFKLWLHLRSTRGVSARPHSKRNMILHVVPGLKHAWNGMSVAARIIGSEQSAYLMDLADVRRRHIKAVDEIWIHSVWLPSLWKVSKWVKKYNKRLVRMTHGNLDPVRLRYHGWKKWLVGPIERYFLRKAEKIVVTCEAEAEWVRQYLGKKCPKVEVTDVKRFFKLRVGEWGSEGVESGGVGEWVSGGVGECENTSHVLKNSASLPLCTSAIKNKLHLLYLGRRHPLKGVEFLEQAVEELNGGGVGEWVNSKLQTRNYKLKIVSDAFGEEKEKVWEWCDVLVLPTLSENFGLVVAEALERGIPVITTDGAPVWENQPGVTYLKGYRDGTPAERVSLLKEAIKTFS